MPLACIRVDVIAIRCRRAGYSTGSARSTPRAWTKCLAGGFSDVAQSQPILSPLSYGAVSYLGYKSSTGYGEGQ